MEKIKINIVSIMCLQNRLIERRIKIKVINFFTDPRLYYNPITFNGIAGHCQEIYGAGPAYNPIISKEKQKNSPHKNSRGDPAVGQGPSMAAIICRATRPASGSGAWI